jgi:hypothetical protein
VLFLVVHNPYAAELEREASRLVDLRERCAALAKARDWYAAFDRDAVGKKLVKQRARRDDLVRQRDRTQIALNQAAKQSAALHAESQMGHDPFYWFSKKRGKAKERYAVSVSHRNALTKEVADLERRLERARAKVKKSKRTLAKYDRFNCDAVVAELAIVESEIAACQANHDALVRDKQRLDDLLAGPVSALERLERDLSEATSRQTTLRSNLRSLQRDLKVAARLKQELDDASDKHDKWIVHKECEDEFDDGSPGRVLHDRRDRRSQVQGELSSLERQIASLERNTAKARKRVEETVARGTRDIRSVVIDGNNLCYVEDQFIGIAALQPLSQHLRESYQLAIVFDASILRLLSGSAEPRHRLTEDHLRVRFPGISVHVVDTQRQADETVLDAATDATAYVISNDRFQEFTDKPAVEANRVLRHEIVNGHIRVPDLSVLIPFGVRN